MRFNSRAASWMPSWAQVAAVRSPVSSRSQARMARRHHTDGGGDSDHVFALCSLLGFQFAPRIPDLKSRRLYIFGKAATCSLRVRN
jgi:TnpA family transposase